MRAPERYLALLRIVVGGWFLKGVVTKLGVVMLGGGVPVPGASARWRAVMPTLLTRYATEHPLEWYREFLTNVVIPNGPRVATLTALGEVVVGLGLTLGLLTPVSAAIGATLVILYGLATFHMGPSQQGFHLVLLACMVAFFLARAGRHWGIDGIMRRRFPRWPG